MKKVINAIGYIRVSTHEQAEVGFSLKAQEAEIRKHCEQNGLNLLGVFCDAGITGTSIQEQKEFQRLLTVIAHAEEVYGTELNYVLVSKLSRLSRNMTDLLNSLEFFEKHNIFFKSINEGIDTSTQSSKNFIMTSKILSEIEQKYIGA